MMKRIYRCPECGNVTEIDQAEADVSRVLQGEIPSFVWCMVCKKKAGKRIRVWADEEEDRDPYHYSMIGTRGNYAGFNRKMRRTLKRVLKKTG